MVVIFFFVRVGVFFHCPLLSYRFKRLVRDREIDQLSRMRFSVRRDSADVFWVVEFQRIARGPPLR